MADETDKAIAALAVDLNEDAKAARKAKAKGGGNGNGPPPEGKEAATAAVTGGGWDVEADRELAVEKIEALAEALEINPKEVVADLRDFVLQIIKDRPKPWSATPQAEQMDLARAVENACSEAVRKVVEAVATKGTDAIRVLLTKVNMSGDIVITGKVKSYGDDDEDAAVLQLHRAIGKHVMLTRATLDDYQTGERDPETDPDEPGFDYNGED